MQLLDMVIIGECTEINVKDKTYSLQVKKPLIEIRLQLYNVRAIISFL